MKPSDIKRIRGDLSQVGFARIVGVSELTISRWENGHVKPEGGAVTLLQLFEKDRGRVLSMINSIRLEEVKRKVSV
jgi:DNA-binding transcriptional regulator YiaG